MKNLINSIKLWLFRKLMEDICRNSSCQDCEAHLYPDKQRNYSCAQSETLAQAMKVWGKDPESDKKRDWRYR